MSERDLSKAIDAAAKAVDEQLFPTEAPAEAYADTAIVAALPHIIKALVEQAEAESAENWNAYEAIGWLKNQLPDELLDR